MLADRFAGLFEAAADGELTIALSTITLAEVLTDDEDVSVETRLCEEQMVEAVKRALSRLTPREEKIMRLRFGIAEISDQEREKLLVLGFSPEETEETHNADA